MLDILSLLLVGVYIISTMGYGIHECMHEGTKDLILLFGESPCEYLHPNHRHTCSADQTHSCNSESCSANAGCAVDDMGCCSTTTYTLSEKQLNQREMSAEPLWSLADSLPIPGTVSMADVEDLFFKLVKGYTSGFINIPEQALSIVSASQIRI